MSSIFIFLLIWLSLMLLYAVGFSLGRWALRESIKKQIAEGGAFVIGEQRYYASEKQP